MKYIFFFILIIMSDACVSLNGTYCTKSDLSAACITFDKKEKIMTYEFDSYLSGAIRKGYYKRKGKLLIVDLIPYDIGKERGKVEIKYGGKSKKDSILIKIQLQDSIAKEELISIIQVTDNQGNVSKMGTDIEGKVSFYWSKTQLPIEIKSQGLGHFNKKIKMEKAENVDIIFSLIGEDYLHYSTITGRELYRIEVQNKNHFRCKRIEHWDERKFTTEDKKHRIYAFYKRK